MRVQLWDIAFHNEFKGKGVHKNSPPEKQVGMKQAINRTLYRYFMYILFPRKAISKTPSSFSNYLEKTSDMFMYTDDIMKTWGREHWEHCGWYLDCPVKKPPSFDIEQRNNIQPDLLGSEMVVPSLPSEIGGKKPRVSKRKAAMDADVAAKAIVESEVVAKSKTCSEAAATEVAKALAAKKADLPSQ